MICKLTLTGGWAWLGLCCIIFYAVFMAIGIIEYIKKMFNAIKMPKPKFEIGQTIQYVAAKGTKNEYAETAIVEDIFIDKFEPGIWTYHCVSKGDSSIFYLGPMSEHLWEKVPDDDHQQPPQLKITGVCP